MDEMKPPYRYECGSADAYENRLREVRSELALYKKKYIEAQKAINALKVAQQLLDQQRYEPDENY